MFINISNHPSATWGENQTNAALKYGEIIDISFPLIDPLLSTQEVIDLAYQYLKKVELIVSSSKEESVVHVMGEHLFTFHLVTILLNNGYKVIESASYKDSIMEGDKKISIFHFVQFRFYQ